MTADRTKPTPQGFLKPGVQPAPVPTDGPRIPRKIWQTTKDRTSIKPELKSCVDRLLDMNPNWEYQLYDDASQFKYLQSVCTQRFMDAYARIPDIYGAARADMFRYVKVYLEGGVYMDLKSGTTKPLDQILRPDDDFIISQWDNGPDGMFPGVGKNKPLRDIPGGEYEQWFVIASPGHPFLRAIIEQVLENIETYRAHKFGHGSKGVHNVYGPNVYTRTIHRLENDYPCRKITAWTEGLRYTTFENLHSHQSLDKNHYLRKTIPPVTDKGLQGAERLSYWIWEAIHWPYSKIRGLNNRRLFNRNMRKVRKQAQKDL